MRPLSQTELAQDRRWRLKAWTLLVLGPDQVAAMFARSMPPTIAELIALARRRAEEYAGKCPSCGVSLPDAAPRARSVKRKSKSKPFTATKGA